MSESSNSILKFVRITLSVLAVPLLAFIVVKNWDKFTVAFATPVTQMFLIVAVSVFSLFANSLRLQLVSRLFDVRLGPLESFTVASANSFYNIVTPMKGGIAVKGMYLNQVRQMPWPRYVGSLAVTQLLATATSTLFALIVLFVFDVMDRRWVLAIAVTLVVIAWLLWHQRNKFRSLFAKSEYLAELPDHLARLASHKSALLLFVGAHALFLASISTRLFLVFAIFVPEIEFWQVVLIQSILTAAMFISLTPGNIGIQEGMVAVASAYLAVDPSAAVLASLSERAFLLLTVLPVGGLCSLLVMRKISASART